MPEVPFAALPIVQDDLVYAYGPDSERGPGVIPGRIDEFRIDDSERYPGTTRRVWVHTPHGHDTSAPAAVTIFNDGWWYLDPDAAVRAGIVLDNLAASGEIPPMVGVFVDPGVRDGGEKNRNIEFDADDAQYADFLAQEVLPLVAERVALSADPAMYGICGGSSGGNAAFTAAWMRPDRIRRVLAFNSSFAQMPGGNPYPAAVRVQEAKPLRVFLHAAHRDIGWNEPKFNWFSATLETAAALAETGYDLRLVVGDGGHSPNHGGVLLPDALRWLWRD